MADQSDELEVLRDLIDEAGVVGQLGKDGQAFAAACQAYRAGDAKAFQAVLARLGLGPRCGHTRRSLTTGLIDDPDKWDGSFLTFCIEH